MLGKSRRAGPCERAVDSRTTSSVGTARVIPSELRRIVPAVRELRVRAEGWADAWIGRPVGTRDAEDRGGPRGVSGATAERSRGAHRVVRIWNNGDWTTSPCIGDHPPRVPAARRGRGCWCRRCHGARLEPRAARLFPRGQRRRGRRGTRGAHLRLPADAPRDRLHPVGVPRSGRWPLLEHPRLRQHADGRARRAVHRHPPPADPEPRAGTTRPARRHGGAVLPRRRRRLLLVRRRLPHEGGDLRGLPPRARPAQEGLPTDPARSLRLDPMSR